ncbi:unnamed protein product [Lymnaea stagnalis]|uniref:TNFR-Cys domain-containing protein n=1 Tax=Lymnaea stagnalis TaxID=6523 RepID=A0AAV2H372_LYMST
MTNQNTSFDPLLANQHKFVVMAPTHVLVLFMLLVAHSTDKCSGMPLNCGAGQFLNKTQGANPFCQECPINSYMDDYNHTMESCKTCRNYTVRGDQVVEVVPCNNKSRTKILRCADGFYLEDFLNDYGCKPCDLDAPDCYSSVTEIDTTVDPMETLDPMDSLPVKLDSTSITLTSSTLKKDDSCMASGCSFNEFVKMNCTRAGSVDETILGVLCQPCPSGTHMNKTNHTETSCVSNALSYDDTEGKNTLILALCIAGCAFLLLALIFLFFYFRKKKQQYDPVSIHV